MWKGHNQIRFKYARKSQRLKAKPQRLCRAGDDTGTAHPDTADHNG